MTQQPPGGPWFEDLKVGDVFDQAPAMTLTSGHAAAHQAICGDRLRLPLDEGLSRAVLGRGGVMAHPALVWDIAIGQSTLVTQRVIANLFYRGLAFHRAPVIGDTLRTVTTVAGLRRNRPRPVRAATGMAALRIRTTDQEERTVLDFARCAMLPLRDAGARTGPDDDLDAITVLAGEGPAGEVPPDAAVSGWDLGAFPGRGASWRPPVTWEIPGGDVVSSAPELARLTLNIAAVHHDASAGGRGRRLVYGGHTIALAAAQACRVLPGLVTITAWASCDHLAPVFEGDTLTSELTLEAARERAGGGALLSLRSVVTARRPGEDPSQVLDWRFTAVAA